MACRRHPILIHVKPETPSLRLASTLSGGPYPPSAAPPALLLGIEGGTAGTRGRSGCRCSRLADPLNGPSRRTPSSRASDMIRAIPPSARTAPATRRQSRNASTRAPRQSGTPALPGDPPRNQPWSQPWNGPDKSTGRASGLPRPSIACRRERTSGGRSVGMPVAAEGSSRLGPSPRLSWIHVKQGSRRHGSHIVINQSFDAAHPILDSRPLHRLDRTISGCSQPTISAWSEPFTANRHDWRAGPVDDPSPARQVRAGSQIISANVRTVTAHAVPPLSTSGRSLNHQVQPVDA
jgi:hypothetical protein